MRIHPTPIIAVRKRSACCTRGRDVVLFVPLGNSSKPIALGSYFEITPSGRWFDALRNRWVAP